MTRCSFKSTPVLAFLIALAILVVAAPRPSHAVVGAVAAAAASPSAPEGDAADAPSAASDLARRLDAGEITAAEARAEMAGMADAEVRAAMLDIIDRRAAAANAGAPANAAERIIGNEAALALLVDRLAPLAASFHYIPEGFAVIGDRLQAGRDEPVSYLVLLAKFLLVLALGGLAVYGVQRWAAGRQAQMASQAGTSTPTGFAGVMRGLTRLGLELVGAAAFYIVASVVLYVAQAGHRPSIAFSTTYITAITQVLAVMAIARFLMPLDNPLLRLVKISDSGARRIQFYTLILSIIWSFGFLTCALLVVYGAPPDVHAFFQLWTSLIFLGVIVFAFFRLRNDVATLIRAGACPSGDPSVDDDADFGTRLRHRFAGVWHIVASLYMVVVWGLTTVWSIGAGDAEGGSAGLISFALFICTPIIDRLCGRLIIRRFRDPSGKISPLGRSLHHSVRLFLYVCAAVVFARVWGIDPRELADASIGARLTGGLINAGLVAMVAYSIWKITRAVIDTQLTEAVDEDDPDATSDGEGGGKGATRIATLLPLLRSTIFVVLGVVTLLIMLSGLGVDIAPLLAGAGVVGLAVGFGAQALVRDVVSGMFFLIDDAFRKGEYVDVGSAKGTVEKISIRSFRLRHHLGPINTVPFGEIATITNFSRDWVIMKLVLRLTYDNDPQKVKKLIKNIGAEMAQNPEFKNKLLQPPKSQGVLQMDDSAMVLRVKFMAIPGQQFVLRRELLHRIRAVFAENGVQFAHREVTVHVASHGDRGRDKGGEITAAERAEAAAAAARRVIDDEERLSLDKPTGLAEVR